jgi:hypothetical protein
MDASAAGFLAFFVGVWLAVSVLLSLLGGWHALAQAYRAPEGFTLDPADRFRARSIQLRRLFLPANYNGCITLGVTRRGLYLAPMPPFRFLHPPLLVPWQDIVGLRLGRFLWWRWAAIELRGADTRMRLYGSIGELVRSEWQRRTGRLASSVISD